MKNRTVTIAIAIMMKNDISSDILNISMWQDGPRHSTG